MNALFELTLLKVEPLKGPLGLIFYIKFRYGKDRINPTDNVAHLPAPAITDVLRNEDFPQWQKTTD